MHELSLAQSIIQVVEDEIKDRNIKAVKAVRLKIGRLAGVQVESLEFCFEISAENTLLENAKLEITEVPVNCICKDCEKNFKPKTFIFVCPHCKSHNFEIIQGREMDIENIEIEE